MLFVYVRILLSIFLFFFNDTATTEIYTLSLHDALPISHRRCSAVRRRPPHDQRHRQLSAARRAVLHHGRQPDEQRRRSEEHTSELQSQSNLVCRLLLEKKKQSISTYLHPCALRVLSSHY